MNTNNIGKAGALLLTLIWPSYRCNPGLEQSSMGIRRPLSSRLLPANKKRGGQDNLDGAKRADDQGHWAEEEREKVRVWEDKGAETKENGKGFLVNGEKKKPLVRSTKKRHL